MFVLQNYEILHICCENQIFDTGQLIYQLAQVVLYRDRKNELSGERIRKINIRRNNHKSSNKFIWDNLKNKITDKNCKPKIPNEELVSITVTNRLNINLLKTYITVLYSKNITQ